MDARPTGRARTGVVRPRRMSRAEPALEFDNVTLSLGGLEILRGVSFTIEPGEFVAVLGPNGAGKTTLMRAALGLLPTRSGSIRVLGRPAGGRGAIGYMPQARNTAPL